MKRFLSYLAVVALALSSVSFTGCATIKKAIAVGNYETSPQTSEAILVSAEKTSDA